MITAKKSPFEQAVDYLADLKPLFAGLPRRVTDDVREIRLRAGQPVVLECKGERLQIGGAVLAEDIGRCMREFCEYSVHSCEKQFREGWLTLKGGHRAGFCGTAVLKNGKVESIRDVSSVNLRIARQFVGCGDKLYEKIESSDSLTGLLVIGRPMSAKTTVLRDLCRSVSRRHKVALIDERGEMAAVHAGIPSLDVGVNTDILDNFPKTEGIMNALRNLSPEFIICDELGWEAKELAACFNSGVKLILSAHCGGFEEARASERIRTLLFAGGISHVALLGAGADIGKLMGVLPMGYEYYGNNRGFSGSRGGSFDNFGDGGGSLFLLPSESAGGKAEGNHPNAYGNVAFD